MVGQFVGQLLLVGFNFAPAGWMFAAGQTLSISQNTALFSLLGTFYGGNGTSNFMLPNLQGNCAIGFGQGPGLSSYDIGQAGGTQSVTLLTTEIPSHNHTPMAFGIPADQTTPAGNSFAKSSGGSLYTQSTSPLAQLSPSAVNPSVGGNLPHNNMMPYLALNWIIAINGIYPPRS